MALPLGSPSLGNIGNIGNLFGGPTNSIFTFLSPFSLLIDKSRRNQRVKEVPNVPNVPTRLGEPFLWRTPFHSLFLPFWTTLHAGIHKTAVTVLRANNVIQ